MPTYTVISIERELRKVVHQVDCESPEEAVRAVKFGDEDKASYIGSEHFETEGYVRTVSVTEIAGPAGLLTQTTEVNPNEETNNA